MKEQLRHSIDFIVLASLISARDFRETELDKKDKKRLRKMLERCSNDSVAMAVGDAATSLDRLVRAAGLE